MTRERMYNLFVSFGSSASLVLIQDTADVITILIS